MLVSKMIFNNSVLEKNKYSIEIDLLSDLQNISKQRLYDMGFEVSDKAEEDWIRLFFNVQKRLVSNTPRTIIKSKEFVCPPLYCEALKEILQLTNTAFINDDMASAVLVEPLEQVIDNLKAKIKSKHIERLQNSECTIELGFILSDLLNDLERISDHCSNIAGCIIEIAHNSLGMHEYFGKLKKDDSFFKEHYSSYLDKYLVQM